jgi:predicted nuclease of predicted toxin-antitoxin system
MDFKLDENMPAGLVGLLAPLGHDVDTVPQEQLAGRDDGTIWNAAQAAGRFLITTDLDFSDIRQFRPGAHHGLMLVRLQNPGRRALSNRVHAVFRAENVADWKRCFVVVTDRKIRIRRP